MEVITFPISGPLATVTLFLKLYDAVQLKKLNEQSLKVLKRRIESTYSAIGELFQDNTIIEKAMQSLQDLVRRFHAAVQSAVLLLERIESAWYVTKLFRSAEFKDRMLLVGNELTGCATDMNMILSIKLFKTQQEQDQSPVAQKVLMYLQQSQQEAEKWQQAIAQDLKNNEAILRDLQAQVQQNIYQSNREIQNIKSGIVQQMANIQLQQNAQNQQLHAHMNHMGAEMNNHAQGLHNHINRVEDAVGVVNNNVQVLADQMDAHNLQVLSTLDKHRRDILKQLSKAALNLQGKIEPRQIKDLTVLYSGRRHIVYACMFSKTPEIEDSWKPVVFKSITPNSRGIVDAEGITRTEREHTALMKLSRNPYFPCVIGFYQQDATTTGVVMEGVFMARPPPSKDSSANKLTEKHTRDILFPSLAVPITSMTLQDYLSTRFLEWSLRLRFMQQFTSALKYMHDSQQNIVHGLITTQDILVTLDKEGYEHIKIIDFDRCLIHMENTAKPSTDLSLLPPSKLPFVAPEMLASGPSRGHVSFATDIYAAGSVLWSLACPGCQPWEHVDPNEIINEVCQGHRDVIPASDPANKVHDGMPVEIAATIMKCWAGSPERRPTAPEVEEALTDVFVPNFATSQRLKPDTSKHTVAQWRDAYVRARMGISVEDLVTVRLTAEILMHNSFPDKYFGNAEQRRREAIKLLQLSVEQYQDGGAAYFLSTTVYKKDPVSARHWLEEASKLGHPGAKKLLAETDFKANKITQLEYNSVVNDVIELVELKTKLQDSRRVTRRESANLVAAS